jgi:glucose-1-phosphate thymidylyltransferase
MWGVIPAAGIGSRIQPLAFSKELLPVGSRMHGGIERPRAVSEYVVDRMVHGGADRLCFVIAPGKSDIMEYFGAERGGAAIYYAVQEHAVGLCDALFRAAPLAQPDEPVLIGLPDTIWLPEDGYCLLPEDSISFLLFQVQQPQRFDAVLTDPDGWVTHIQVKEPNPATSWVWGAIKLSGTTFRELRQLWLEPGRGDEYLGTLVNAYLERGGRARAVHGGQLYLDVGTVDGYRGAMLTLSAAG